MRSAETPQGVFYAHHHSKDGLIFSIIDPLDFKSSGQAWRTVLRMLQQVNPRRLIIDATDLLQRSLGDPTVGTLSSSEPLTWNLRNPIS